MSAGLSKEQISRAEYRGLKALEKKLRAKGIEGAYRGGILRFGSRCNTELAYYRVIRASNGEVAGIPTVKLRDGRVVSEFGAFDLISEAVNGN